MKKILSVTVPILLIIVVFSVYFYQTYAPKVTGPVDIDLSIFKNGEDVFITPQELKEKIGDKNLIILDGNHPKSYAKGHIPNAISIGFKGLCRSTGKPGDPLWGTILPKAELTTKLESLGINNDSLIVAYSDTFKGPGAGGRAVWQLRMAGLTNVKLLWGGLAMWKSFGYQTSKEAPTLTPTTGLTLKDYDESQRNTFENIASNINSIKLLDTRSYDEFSGADSSRGEARAGRIKNAKLLEWGVLLNKDASPKTPYEIKEILANLGVKPEDDFTLY
ncbi:MAG: rhodanese-like domain-containing protein [Desulfotalea sp.]